MREVRLWIVEVIYVPVAVVLGIIVYRRVTKAIDKKNEKVYDYEA